MKNKKIIIIAASLVLAAALVLCGCMYLIGEPPAETQQYDTTDEMSVPSVIEETPTAQSEMQKKFAAYGKEEIGESGEKIFHLFTKEQIDESLQLRKEGVRRSLTYDEIVFLINDTVRIYFEYDQIVMADFAEHTQGVTRSLYHDNGTLYYTEDLKGVLLSTDWDIFHILGEYDSCVGDHDYDFMTLDAYHGDFSECETYEAAYKAYSSMINQIEMMISERLRILDTGTLCYCAVGGHSARNEHIYGILFDNGAYKDAQKYEEAFEDKFKGSDSSYSYLIGSREYSAYSDSLDSSIFYIENGVSTKIFPTSEIEAVRPRGAVHLSWQNETKSLGIPKKTVEIDIDRWNATVEIIIKETSQAYVETHYTGTFEAKGDLLILKLENGTEVVIQYDGAKYRFVEAVRKGGPTLRSSNEVVFNAKYDEHLEVIKINIGDLVLSEIFETVTRETAGKIIKNN